MVDGAPGSLPRRWVVTARYAINTALELDSVERAVAIAVERSHSSSPSNSIANAFLPRAHWYRRL